MFLTEQILTQNITKLHDEVIELIKHNADLLRQINEIREVVLGLVSMTMDLKKQLADLESPHIDSGTMRIG